MFRTRLAPTAAALLSAACTAASAPAPQPGPGAPAATAGAEATPAQLAEGERVFGAICSACHTQDPPPQNAPPMSHVSMHYREAFASREEALAHLTDFVRAPAAEKSMLPQHARERWGLMPPLALPDEQLQAVAAYVWSLGADRGPMHPMHPGGMHHHRGGPPGS